MAAWIAENGACAASATHEATRTASPQAESYDQHQSLLFSMLPLDVRRHIYLQTWMEYGMTQHIIFLNHSTHLARYPCLLEKRAFELHQPRPPTPDHEESSETDLEEEPTQLSSGDSDNGPDDEGGEIIDPGTSQDDPGDIGGAYQDLSAGPPSDGNSSVNFAEAWTDSPWGAHKVCDRAHMAKFNNDLFRLYSANYRRSPLRPLESPGMLLPMLLCRRMYKEAIESLYSSVAFSFPGMEALEVFMERVPRTLTERIQFADVQLQTSTVKMMPPHRLTPSDKFIPSLRNISMRLGNLLATIRTLRLTMHLHTPRRQIERRPLPNKQWFQPLFDLTNMLQKRNLHTLTVKVVTRCDGECLDEVAWVTYGSTPRILMDAPSSVALVPQGWDPEYNRTAYWLDQVDGLEEDFLGWEVHDWDSERIERIEESRK